LTISGSSSAGWTFPAVSIAREAIVCSPAVGRHSSDQNFQANSLRLRSSVAFTQLPPSIWTSTRDLGAPGRAGDAVLRSLAYHPAGCGIDAPPTDRGFGPKTLAVALLLADVT
jgi:hypothetical protein